jgi:hypothetical protein
LTITSSKPVAKPPATRRNKLTIYNTANHEAAQIILASPKYYAGLPSEWAQMWTEKQVAATPADGQFELQAVRRKCA